VLTIRIGTPLAEVTARLLDETLRVTKGNKTLTARLLGIDPRTVSRKLERQEDEGAEEPPADAGPA
jgi:DNA-binding protein Fis